MHSLQHILNAGVKILFVASLNDQVVPLYSALFSSLSHPNILRTIFIDSSVFETSADFMTNLVSAVKTYMFVPKPQDLNKPVYIGRFLNTAAQCRCQLPWFGLPSFGSLDGLPRRGRTLNR